MVAHLQHFPKPTTNPTQPTTTQMPRMANPSQMASLHRPPPQQDIERVCTLLRDLADKVPEALQCVDGEAFLLTDSKAVPTVDCHSRPFPGAKIEESLAQNAGATYQTATGHPSPNKGQLAIPGTTHEGQSKTIVLQYAGVTCPILSTGNLADEDNDILYSQNGRTFIDLNTGDGSRFVRKWCVYFSKPKIPME